MASNTLQIFYLVSAVFFILGLKFLNSPHKARFGNQISAVGMILAIAVTLILQTKTQTTINWKPIWIGAAIGSLIGLVSALKVKMTAMPQMVALFNGFGGAASFVVALYEFLEKGLVLGVVPLTAIFLSILVGGVTFTGSVVAFAKLQELMPGRPILFKGQHFLNLFILLVVIALSVQVSLAGSIPFFLIIGMLSLILGILVVIPIGGADMPVVISLLNSYSGVAVATTGFVLNENSLIIVGSLVGASGFILTAIMCKAMNRSLANVLFGGFGAKIEAGAVALGLKGAVKEGTAEDAADLLANAQSVIIVPGYGMAVSQAQHVVSELTLLLQKKGVNVRYAIHPVAGRMPGHMNVLLAEANVPYEQLFDIDQINNEFSRTDVALVVGANDVVNPAAKKTPGSPIYGMPVLNVDEARAAIFLKRSLRPGFAGIDNELFIHPKTMMVFGDAKKTLTEMVQILKE